MVFSLLWMGCATCPSPQPAAGAPPATGGSDPSAIGHLDAGVLARMRQIQLIDHVKLALNHDGSVRKFEVYHNDAAPIPQAVRGLANQLFPTHKILTYETEWHQDDGEITELVLRDSHNRICELSATNDGRTRYVECRIAAEDLPPPVRASVAQTLPEARIEEANQYEDRDGRAFKVDAQQGTLVHGLKVLPDGKVVGHTIKINAQLIIAE